MKRRLSLIAFSVGLLLAMGPWVLLDKPSRYWLLVSAIGGVLTSIAGYNAQASMMGWGEPGEEILQNWWCWTKRMFGKISKKRTSNDPE